MNNPYSIAFFFVLIRTAVFFPPIQAQTPIINEVMSRNDHVISDEEGGYPDWIELYNPSNETIELEGFHLSDNVDEPLKWQFPAGINIGGNGYLLIFASDKDQFSPPFIHTNFKISSSGETILFSDKGGNLLDKLEVIPLQPNQSYGSYPNGSEQFVIFDNSTPNSSNQSPVQLTPLQFSHTGGFYAEAFELEVIAASSNDEIYYTLDGSPPLKEGRNTKKYTTPISLYNRTEEANFFSTIPTNPSNTSEKYRWKLPDYSVPKAWIIKACAYRDGQLISPISSHTFWVGLKYDLPVVAISTDSLHLFDYEKGIYIAGKKYDDNPNAWHPGNYYERGDEWERPAYLEYYDADGTLQLAQNMGVRIHGDGSRIMPAKSLRLYARSEYGKNDFDHVFFDNRPYSSYKRLILRNSGQDFYKSMMADVLMQHIVRDMDLELQAAQAAMVFLNGEFWGMHHLRERFDKHFLANYHDLPKDSIDLIEFKMNQTASEGDLQNYEQLIDFVSNHDLQLEGNYAQLEGWIDVENFVDYQIAKLYFGVFDWPGNNAKMWRTRQPNSKWRWLFFDNDDGMLEADFNSIAHAMNDSGTNWPNPAWSTLLFRKALENHVFREQFLDRFSFHLYHTFHPDTLSGVIASFRNSYEAPMLEHIQRWQYPSSLEVWEGHLEGFEAFVLNRPCYLENYLREAFSDESFAFDCKDVVHIGGVEAGRLFDVFPNPCREILEVKFLSKSVNLQKMVWSLKDISGRTIAFSPNNASYLDNQLVLDVSDLSEGIYFLQVAIGGGRWAQKVLKF